MIVGVFLRYFKTYQGINYIPITDEDRFCGLVGENGIGKSSILEALDCFFNSKEWNFHTATKKSGKQSTKPSIVPVFLIQKKFFQEESDEFNKASLLSDFVLNAVEENVIPSTKSHMKKFIEHRNIIKRNIKIDDYFFLPIGLDYENNISISIFNSSYLLDKLHEEKLLEGKTSLNEEELNDFKPVLSVIKDIIEYIYIPREIDPESFTKLETKEIQVLMGETLNQILSDKVTSQQILEINKNLNGFLKTLEDELGVYSYRTPTDRQQQLRKSDVYNLIIQAFFNIRKLHKKHGESWMEINSLSSGEKQKAIIDVAHGFLSKHRKSGANLIIAVDEPESSLHMSACFDQFDSLYDISRECMQVMFSSHWYGFLPVIESGSATIISKREGTHVFDQINLGSYREQIKQMTACSKGRLPFDIRLKSMNDFVQSVITSSMGAEPYNWLICEGSSEKIYLSKYFEDLIESKKLRIVPVGGAKEIKRLYNYLEATYEDFKNEINGKIILISDTDAEFLSYNVTKSEKLICKRMVNCHTARTTKLVNIQSNPVSPATEIESSLSGKTFYQTLLSFKDDYSEDLGFLTKGIEEISDQVSYFALDLRASEWEAINKFFDKDNNKFRFAKCYIENIDENHVVPNWIKEIRGWLESNES